MVALAGIALSSHAFESPSSPDQVLAAFQHDPGLSVELVAAEPLVFQPCAVTWDAEGHLFVAENRGYPTGPGPGQPPVGTIARLDDADGDGHMDRRTVFADGLTFPNGLTPWNGGLIVTCAPDVLFLKDTDGDGRADERVVLLTGFDTNSTTQLRVSHPTLGPDGWIYLTSGLTRASKITSPKHPERPAVEIGADARFNPFTLEIEPVGGRGQFGQTFDDAGNRLQCMNRVHIQHTVIAPRYVARNPNYALAETVQNVPEAMVTDLIGGANQNFAARLYPISDNLTTADSHVGTFTAACAVHIYRGDALPAEYRGDAFACDPTANLVHRDKLTQVGPTFASRMANEGREFLASPDNWFRPVFLATGPDGALYVCDMYRKTIEHPEYLPVEVRKRTDFTSGRDMGRIWRVTGKNTKRQTPNTKPLARASTRELIHALGHQNAWHRETAQRLLIQRQVPKLPSQLAKQFKSPGEADLKQRIKILHTESWLGLPNDSKHTDTFQRLHALRTLAILAANERSADLRSGVIQTDINVPGWRPALLDQALRKSVLASDPVLRENAWRILTEQQRNVPGLPEALFPVFAADPNPRARFWFALGFNQGTRESRANNWAEVLGGLAVSDGTNRWMRAAILSGLKSHEQQALQLARHLTQRKTDPAPVEFWTDLGRVLGAETGTVPQFFAMDSPPSPWLIAALDGVTEALRSRGKTVALPAELLPRFTTEAACLAASVAEPVATRKAGIGFLVNAESSQASAALLPVLVATEPAELQVAAVRSLLGLPGDTAATELLTPARWTSLPPNTRGVVVSSLLAQPRHVRSLLTAVETKQIPENVLNRTQREALRKHSDAAIRERAQLLFAAAETGDRMKAYEKARAVLSLTGNPVNGRKPFATHCASCHRLDREGHNVGPDLFGIRNQPKESILLHIVHPNYEFVSGFNACTVECKDGRELTGLIIGESPASVTLRKAQGIEETIPRSGINKLTVGQVSLMPEGLETAMSQQELADLLACLKGE
ncbi:MAG: c-type cytochrome [Verrucomicrobia bacterium]|nr:c-type cytochrome [Verrucomicrobiota bacterium]